MNENVKKSAVGNSGASVSDRLEHPIDIIFDKRTILPTRIINHLNQFLPKKIILNWIKKHLLGMFLIVYSFAGISGNKSDCPT